MTKKSKNNTITHTSNFVGNILTTPTPITHTSNIVGNILTSKTTHKKNFRRVNNFVFPKKRKG